MSPGNAAAPRGGRTASLAFPALLLGATGIAFAPIFVRLSELEPVATAFYRLLFALPVLWLWQVHQRASPAQYDEPRGLADYWQLSLAGLFFAGDLAVWHWSITLTSVANATLLANFAPIFVTFSAWFFFNERCTKTFLAGMVTGIVGAAVLMGESVDLGARHVLGDALGLLTAVFYGAYILSISRLRYRFTTATIMAWSGSVTCIVLLPVALLSGESLWAVTLYGWAVLAGLALISHAGGQSLIAYALAHLPAPFSSVSLLLQPLLAALLAWIILAEPVRIMQGLGGLIILAGIFLARRGSR